MRNRPESHRMVGSQWMRPTPARSAGVLGALSIVCVLVLSACGDGSASSHGNAYGDYEVVNVKTPDGTVTCVIWDGTQAGNIDCNWGGVK